MDTHRCDDLFDAASEGHEACVTTLIAAGADPNAADVDGITPLYWAARGGYEACVRLLIEAGADPNVVNVNGNTPFCTGQPGTVTRRASRR